MKRKRQRETLCDILQIQTPLLKQEGWPIKEADKDASPLSVYRMDRPGWSFQENFAG